MFFFIQSDDCGLNKFFISINLILCVIISVISILPAVQEKLPRSGLLQSSVVSLYVVYLTWSTVSSQPGNLFQSLQQKQENNKRFCFADKNCNPGLLGIVGAGSNVDATQMGFDKEGIIGLIVWMACVLYSSLRSASKSSKITMSEHVLVKDNGAGK